MLRPKAGEKAKQSRDGAEGPDRTAGRKSSVRPGWSDSVSEAICWRTDMNRAAQQADGVPERPDNTNPNGMERRVVLVRSATPTTADWSGRMTKRDGGIQVASPQRSADHVQTRTVPAKCTSAGGVEGRQTSLSSHTTKDRGRGRLSRLSDGEEAARKDLTNAD